MTTSVVSNSTSLLLVGAAAAPADGPPSWITDVALPAGQVRAISLNTLRDVWEGPQPGGNGHIGLAVQAWTSGIDAPLLGTHGAKIWSGGGDGDGWDTAAFAFDYRTQRWSRIKDRTTALSWNPKADRERPVGDPLRFDMTYCEHGDGTPAAPHSYDGYCYVPPDTSGTGKGALVRPVSRFMYPTASTNHSHKLALGERQWSRASTNRSTFPGPALPMCDYDPTSRRVYLVETTDSGFWKSGLYALNLGSGDGVGTHEAIPLGTGRQLFGGNGCLRFWRGLDGDRRYLIWLNFGKPAIIDLDDPAAGAYMPPITEVVASPGHGLAWCAPLRCFFVKNARPDSEASTLYKLIVPTDPLRGTWGVERIALIGVTGKANGIWKRLHYVESLRALTWFYSATGAVYAYRPVGV